MILNILVITDDIDQWFDKFSQSLSNVQGKYYKSYKCVYNDMFCVYITASTNHNGLFRRSYSQVIVDKQIDRTDIPPMHYFPAYTMEYHSQRIQTSNHANQTK